MRTLTKVYLKHSCLAWSKAHTAATNKFSRSAEYLMIRGKLMMLKRWRCSIRNLSSESNYTRASRVASCKNPSKLVASFRRERAATLPAIQISQYRWRSIQWSRTTWRNWRNLQSRNCTLFLMRIDVKFYLLNVTMIITCFVSSMSFSLATFLSASFFRNRHQHPRSSYVAKGLAGTHCGSVRRARPLMQRQLWRQRSPQWKIPRQCWYFRALKSRNMPSNWFSV